jgi:hypothetical protein
VLEFAGDVPNSGHEARVPGLAARTQGLAEVATHPVVLQLVRRMVSPVAKLSSMESCRTDADHVRKELEQTTWEVVHPYCSVEFPGVVDARVNFTTMWFLDELNTSNSTWAWQKPPLADGAYLPRLPHLSSQDEIAAVTKDAKPLLASRGSCWMYMGPMWISNNIGAAAFWKEYDAQTRYKFLSGQKEARNASFKALTDWQRLALPRDEYCPTLIEATYVREYVTVRDTAPPPEALENLKERERRGLEQLLSIPSVMTF